MGASRAHRQWLKSSFLALALISLGAETSCKHRRGPSAPEEWDPAGVDASRADLETLLGQTKSLRFLELFEDGFVITDTLTYRLDLTSSALDVERRFDPVPFTNEEPVLIQKRAEVSAAAQAALLRELSQTSVRQVPRCNPYGAVDGGYGGRFLILVDRSGQEHRFGASDASCATSDHECSGPCLAWDAMNRVEASLSVVLPMPEKPETRFSCTVDSPLPCAQKEFSVAGDWKATTLRPDVRRTLAQRFCNLAAFSLEPAEDGHWRVQNSTRDVIGTVRFNTVDQTVACLTRTP